MSEYTLNIIPPSEYTINVNPPSTYGITLVSEQGPAGSLPQIANSRILGNISGITANAYGLTNSEVKTLLSITSSDVSGVQPLIAAGTTNDYWRGDKTWVTLNQASVAGLTTSDSPVFAGATFSGASLVSTPALSLTGAIYSGGTATTTKPHVLIEPSGTTSTAWSTAGTGIGVNAASGFTGNLIDLKTAGTSRITISATGDINAWSSNVSQRFGSNFYFYNASFNSTSGCTINAGGSGNANIELNTGGAAVSVVMKPKAGQTGDILQIQDASAAVLCKVDITGGLSGTTGTFSGAITVGTGGPKIKNSSGTIQFRNNADSAFSGIQLANVIIGSTGFTMGTSDDYNLTFTTPYAAATEFVSGQSGQFSSLATKTYEGKLAGLKHYDVANANGRLCQLFSSPGVVFSLAPSDVELLRMDGFGVTNLSMPSTALLRWTSGIASAAADLVLTRDAAGVLAQRNGANGQQFRVYTSYTDASNYSRFFIDAATTGITYFGLGAAGTQLAATPNASLHMLALGSSGAVFLRATGGVYVKQYDGSTAGDIFTGSIYGSGNGFFGYLKVTSTHGVLMSDNGGALNVLNNAGNAFANMRCAILTATDGSFSGGITATTGTFSGASLVSAPALSLTGAIYSGGTATTTKPHVLIEPSGTSSTNWSTSGTWIGVNANNAFTGNFIDLQVNGTRRCKIDSNGLFYTTSGNVEKTVGIGVGSFANGTGGIYIIGDTTSYGVSYSEIQSLKEGVGFWPIVLQRRGGNVLIQTTTDNGNALQVSGSVSASIGVLLGTSGYLYGGTNLLEQRNSTNAQTLRVYGSYTDASTYSRASLSCSTTALTLAFESNTGNGDIFLTPKGTGVVSCPNGSLVLSNANYKISGGSGNLQFFTGPGVVATWVDNAVELMRLTSGNLLIGTSTDNGSKLQVNGSITATTGTFSGAVKSVPSASVTLSTNGQLEIEMTSNTNGNICYRGSDGTTRRFNFTLS